MSIALRSGHFSLLDLVEFASCHPDMGGIVSRDYGRLAKGILADVPNESGWYLWGRFDSEGWTTVYAGTSERRKTSAIATRLFDELREEYQHCAWALAWGEDEMWPRMHEIWGDRYDVGVRRALKKIDSQTVIWVTAENLSMPRPTVISVEKALMAHFKPIANAPRREAVFPTDLSDCVIRRLRREIRKIPIAERAWPSE